MCLMKVNYCVRIGKRRFVKNVHVNAVPQIGWTLSIANSYFVVKGVHQDLTSYEENSFGGYTESVEVLPEPTFYEESDFPKIIESIIKDGWKERKDRTKANKK